MTKILFTLMLSFFAMTLFAQTDKVVIKLPGNITLVLERAPFDTTGKKIEYDVNKFPIAVDGKPIIGADRELPKYILKKATLIASPSKYNLPVENIYNPWFGETPNEKQIKIVTNSSEMKLRCLFSEGFGTYAVEWLMVGQSSMRTILSKDQSIILKFFDTYSPTFRIDNK